MQQLPPGTIIDDRYEIVRLLGEGGMGTVFLTREHSLERLVALKILLPDFLSDTDSRSRFEREGKILSRLSHPNIPNFFRFGIWQHLHPYISMEYLDGQSLRDLNQQNEQLAESMVLNIAVQICSGMEAVHKLGIVHRDLKPSNIMILGAGDDCHVKIVDFGLAQGGQRATQSQHHTQTGCLIGSVHYMSPEQCTGCRADNRSDIYALGCVLFEALCGQPPFECENVVGLMHKHTQERPRRLSKLRPDVSGGLEAVILKCMAKDPLNRYQLMGPIIDDLILIREGRGEEVARAFDYLANVSQPASSRRHKDIVAVLGGIALVGLATAAFFNFSRGAYNDKPPALDIPRIGLHSQFRQLENSPPQKRLELALKIADRLEHESDAKITRKEIAFVYRTLCSDLILLNRGVEAAAILNRRLKMAKGVEIAYLLVLRGDVFARSGQLKEAANDFRKAASIAKIANEEKLPDAANLSLADMMLHTGRPTEAKKIAKDLVTDAHNSIDIDLETSALVILAEAYVARGEKIPLHQTLKTIENITTATHRNTLTERTYLSLCERIARTYPGMAGEQIAICMKILTRGHENQTSVNQLLVRQGAYLVAAGQLTRAEQCFRNCIRLLDSSANFKYRIAIVESYEALAKVLLADGRLEECERVSMKGISVCPEIEIDRKELVRSFVAACVKRGSGEKAIDTLILATEGKPSVIRSRTLFIGFLALAEHFSDNRDYSKAVRIVERYLQLPAMSEPDRILARIEIAFYHLRANDSLNLAEALTEIRSMEENEEFRRHRAEYFAQFGLALANTNHRKEARVCFGKVLEENGYAQEAQILCSTGEGYNTIEDQENAIRCFERVLNLGAIHPALRQQAICDFAQIRLREVKTLRQLS